MINVVIRNMINFKEINFSKIKKAFNAAQNFLYGHKPM